MNDALGPLFGTSALRREVLAWFFGHPGAVAHPRELARRLGRSPQVVGRELARLQATGILTSETVGRSRRYRVDVDSPIAADVRSLFAKTLGKPPTKSTIVDDHRAEIEALCRRYGVHRLDVFGSAVRDDFDPKRSDVDFLVQFEPGRTPSLRGYLDLRDALASVLDKPVDLVMDTAVRNPYIRRAIESERRLIYAA